MNVRSLMKVSGYGVGADESPMAPVFPGWNVWSVWQVKDLPFSLSMIGVSRDRQLKIWVEDHVRLEAPGASVADPIDLKGGQIQILNARPSDLKIAKRKEEVSGPPLLIESQAEPPELRFVRFFNRGAESSLPWPHDDAYLLEEILLPNPESPVTKGPGPGTITERNVTDPAKKGAEDVLLYSALAIGTLGSLWFLVSLAASKRGRKQAL